MRKLCAALLLFLLCASAAQAETQSGPRPKSSATKVFNSPSLLQPPPLLSKLWRANQSLSVVGMSLQPKPLRL